MRRPGELSEIASHSSGRQIVLTDVGSSHAGFNESPRSLDQARGGGARFHLAQAAGEMLAPVAVVTPRPQQGPR